MGFVDHPDGTIESTGTFCRGANQPVVPDVSTVIREVVTRALPEATPSFQPRWGALVNVAAIFDSGQSTTWSTTATVLGQSVTVTATPTWTWHWGDGELDTVTAPGGKYPDKSVSHIYRKKDRVLVALDTTWTATYTVDGTDRGTVPGGTITKTSPASPLEIVEARSELIASD